jgi:hypothetical protein
MAVSANVQSYITPLFADWIKLRAEQADLSVSIIVRDLLVEAWIDEYQSRRGSAAIDPVRQNLLSRSRSTRSCRAWETHDGINESCWS